MPSLVRGSGAAAKHASSLLCTNASPSPMSRTADSLPSTARAIALLLSAAPSVQDVQPGVIHQLLEFAHRYTSQVLTDASVYAEHAGHAGKIDMDDVTLAVQARVGWEFGGRVPKEVCHPFICAYLRGCSIHRICSISSPSPRT